MANHGSIHKPAASLRQRHGSARHRAGSRALLARAVGGHADDGRRGVEEEIRKIRRPERGRGCRGAHVHALLPPLAAPRRGAAAVRRRAARSPAKSHRESQGDGSQVPQLPACAQRECLLPRGDGGRAAEVRRPLCYMPRTSSHGGGWWSKEVASMWSHLSRRMPASMDRASAAVFASIGGSDAWPAASGCECVMSRVPSACGSAGCGSAATRPRGCARRSGGDGRSSGSWERDCCRREQHRLCNNACGERTRVDEPRGYASW
mmetsp:Transcript_10542/g.23816  ORF Transcript_10542/g.23816 Transcript_10542/m.23816 type:complete len:263 (+) Transcript_10542:447-1235(+)